mmetsp:Transcript_43208/g.71354  ORF Transcript_43208/g.71354 Transcript_43208/m.71354 type:complete len:123 (-) Transcript_43208:268-636(-)
MSMLSPSMMVQSNNYYREENLMNPDSPDGGFIRKIWHGFGVLYFQYTVIFGVYMMNKPERYIFNCISIFFLGACMYWVSKFTQSYMGFDPWGYLNFIIDGVLRPPFEAETAKDSITEPSTSS